MKNDYLSKVFMNLFLGLLITFLTGYIISTNIEATYFFCVGSMPWILAIIEVVIAIILPVRIQRMSPTAAKILYFLYAGLTGLTFSSLFVYYQMSSLIWIFLMTSVMFGIFAFIGKTTKIDLTRYGIYLLMGLLAVLVLAIINIFVLNEALDMIGCTIGIVIFLGYTAYDMQRISMLNYYNSSEENMAVIGAFNLYLDFINIFIKLLRIFGKSNDN